MKPIKNHEQYWVTRDGRVWSTKKNRYLKGSKRKGYVRVDLGGVKYSVHRLVADAYIRNPHHKREVDHINGIRDDNRVENLRWATPSENMAARSIYGTARFTVNSLYLYEI